MVLSAPVTLGSQGQTVTVSVMTHPASITELAACVLMDTVKTQSCLLVVNAQE